jgi:hypothetical protein
MVLTHIESEGIVYKSQGFFKRKASVMSVVLFFLCSYFFGIMILLSFAFAMFSTITENGKVVENTIQNRIFAGSFGVLLCYLFYWVVSFPSRAFLPVSGLGELYITQSGIHFITKKKYQNFAIKDFTLTGTGVIGTDGTIEGWYKFSKFQINGLDDISELLNFYSVLKAKSAINK